MPRSWRGNTVKMTLKERGWTTPAQAPWSTPCRHHALESGRELAQHAGGCEHPGRDEEGGARPEVVHEPGVQQHAHGGRGQEAGRYPSAPGPARRPNAPMMSRDRHVGHRGGHDGAHHAEHHRDGCRPLVKGDPGRSAGGWCLTHRRRGRTLHHHAGAQPLPVGLDRDADRNALRDLGEAAARTGARQEGEGARGGEPDEATRPSKTWSGRRPPRRALSGRGRACGSRSRGCWPARRPPPGRAPVRCAGRAPRARPPRRRPCSPLRRAGSRRRVPRCGAPGGGCGRALRTGALRGPRARAAERASRPAAPCARASSASRRAPSAPGASTSRARASRESITARASPLSTRDPAPTARSTHPSRDRAAHRHRVGGDGARRSRAPGAWSRAAARRPTARGPPRSPTGSRRETPARPDGNGPEGPVLTVYQPTRRPRTGPGSGAAPAPPALARACGICSGLRRPVALRPPGLVRRGASPALSGGPDPAAR